MPSEGPEPVIWAGWELRLMIEAGEPSTEVIVAKQEMPAPPGIVMVAPQMLLSNA